MRIMMAGFLIGCLGVIVAAIDFYTVGRYIVYLGFIIVAFGMIKHFENPIDERDPKRRNID